VLAKPGGLDGTRLNGRQVVTDDYVCTDCGFYESYIADRDALDALRRRAEQLGDWKPVT
jgi:hypothetical protein